MRQRTGAEFSTRSASSPICRSKRSTGAVRIAAAARRLRTSSVWMRMRSKVSGLIALWARPSILAPIAPISRSRAAAASLGSCAFSAARNSAAIVSNGARSDSTTSALSQLVDAFGQVPNGAFQRDDGIPRREVGQTARHCSDLAAHCVDVGDANALIGSKHGVQFAGQRTNVVTHRLRWLARGAGLPTIRVIARRVITLVGWITGISALLDPLLVPAPVADLRIGPRRRGPCPLDRFPRSGSPEGEACELPASSAPAVAERFARPRISDRGGVVPTPALAEPSGPPAKAPNSQVSVRLRSLRQRSADQCWTVLWKPVLAPAPPPFRDKGAAYGLRQYRRVRSGLLLGKGGTVEARVRALKPQRNRLERLRKSLSIVGHAPLDLLERRLQQVFDLRDLFISRTPRPEPAQTDSPFSACGDPFAATVVKLNVLARFFRSDEGGMLDDRFVQPLFRTHAGAMRCVLGDATGSWAEICGLPRHSFVHTLDRHRR